jgi:hypothetical protein
LNGRFGRFLWPDKTEAAVNISFDADSVDAIARHFAGESPASLRLKEKPQTELGLARISKPALHCAVKIEQQARGLRMLGIGAVRQVEGVQNRLQAEPVAQLDVLVGAKIERKKRIVLPERVAFSDVPVRQDPVLRGDPK